jgi:hypothetical protein
MNGDSYDGSFMNETMDGHGTMYFAQGGQYEGEFKDD